MHFWAILWMFFVGHFYSLQSFDIVYSEQNCLEVASQFFLNLWNLCGFKHSFSYFMKGNRRNSCFVIVFFYDGSSCICCFTVWHSLRMGQKAQQSLFPGWQAWWFDFFVTLENTTAQDLILKTLISFAFSVHLEADNIIKSIHLRNTWEISYW